MATQLFAPSSSTGFDFELNLSLLTISGYSSAPEEYTATGFAYINQIFNNTSLALKIKAFNDRGRVIMNDIICPGEKYSYTSTITDIKLTIYPCVSLNLATTES